MLLFTLIVTTLINFLQLNTPVSSARILGFFPFPSKSHAILGRNLLRDLAERGHEVLLLSSYPIECPHPNYKYLTLNTTRSSQKYKKVMTAKKWWETSQFVYSTVNALVEDLAEDEVIIEMINSSQKFDIIIHQGVSFLLGLAHKLNAINVIFTVLPPDHGLSYYMSLPQPSSYIANTFLQFGTKMNFWQRTMNFVMNTIGYLDLHFNYHLPNEKQFERYFPDAPSLNTMIHNIQLVFINTNIAFDNLKPIYQNMINIGGYYMDKLEELPKDMQQFLDSSKNGVIFMSFGTNVKVENLPPQTLDIFLDVFKELPYDILWVLNTDIPSKPSNVKIYNWVPQLSILNHTNIKLFIGHGGNGGMTEAIYYGIPMLLFPQFSDQAMNAKHCTEHNISLSLNLLDFSKQDLIRAINELIQNPVYKYNIMQRSEVVRNSLYHPMDTVNFWIIYLAKYRNVSFLKTQATILPWYKLLLIDVLLMLGIIFLLVLLLFYYVVKKIVNFVIRWLKVKIWGKIQNKEKSN